MTLESHGSRLAGYCSTPEKFFPQGEKENRRKNLFSSIIKLSGRGCDFGLFEVEFEFDPGGGGEKNEKKSDFDLTNGESVIYFFLMLRLSGRPDGGGAVLKKV